MWDASEGGEVVTDVEDIDGNSAKMGHLVEVMRLPIGVASMWLGKGFDGRFK